VEEGGWEWGLEVVGGGIDVFVFVLEEGWF